MKMIGCHMYIRMDPESAQSFCYVTQLCHINNREYDVIVKLKMIHMNCRLLIIISFNLGRVYSDLKNIYMYKRMVPKRALSHCLVMPHVNWIVFSLVR